MKNGRIAYALAQRVPQLEAAQEPREAPQTTAEDAGESPGLRGEVRLDHAGVREHECVLTVQGA
jgi:hypothetical protein